MILLVKVVKGLNAQHKMMKGAVQLCMLQLLNDYFHNTWAIGKVARIELLHSAAPQTYSAKVDDQATVIVIFAKTRLGTVMRRCLIRMVWEVRGLLARPTTLRRPILFQKGRHTRQCEKKRFRNGCLCRRMTPEENQMDGLVYTNTNLKGGLIWGERHRQAERVRQSFW